LHAFDFKQQQMTNLPERWRRGQIAAHLTLSASPQISINRLVNWAQGRFANLPPPTHFRIESYDPSYESNSRTRISLLVHCATPFNYF
jgi:hypothetical protein